MPENKKHHFVPQYYLKFFSDDNRTVCTYNLKNKGIFKVPIKNVCYGDYFYGQDSGLEHANSAIENVQSVVLRKIINEHALPGSDSDEDVYLRIFLMFQYTRTKDAKERAKEFTDAMIQGYIRPLLKNHFKSKGFSDDEIDSIKITYPADFILHISIALQSAYGISDLTPILIINNTQKNFITSDSPVVFYNYKKVKNRGTIGIQSRGLIIFCPLNCKTMLMLIDTYMYDIHPNEKSILLLNYPPDVDALNTLQFIKSSEHVFFTTEADSDSIKKLHEAAKPFLNDSDFETTIIERPEKISGTVKPYVHLRMKGMNYRLPLTLIGINRKSDKEYKKMVNFITNHHLPFAPRRDMGIIAELEDMRKRNRQRLEAIIEQREQKK